MSKATKKQRNQKHQAKLKRKQTKQQKRKKREASTVAIEPYFGNKYKSNRFVPDVYHTEEAVYDADVDGKGELTDADVRQVYMNLILDLRAGGSPYLEESEEEHDDELSDAQIVANCIKRAWTEDQESGHVLSNSDYIGILRTLLSSIDVWSAKRPGRRGYLEMVAETMRKIHRSGVRDLLEQASLNFDRDDDDDDEGRIIYLRGPVD